MTKLGQATLTGAFLYLIAGSVPANSDNLSGKFSSAGYTRETFYVVWIESQAGAFIKTLRLWGRVTDKYISQLKTWPAISKYNMTDAVTSATPTGSVTDQTYLWNGKNFNGAVVPNGTYSLKIEAVERNDKNLKVVATTFVFDGSSKTVTNAGNTFLKNITINITGSGTPTNNPPVFTSLDTITARTGVTTKWVAKSTDANSDTVTYTYSSLPTGLIPTWMVVSTNTAKDTLKLNPVQTSPDKDTIRVIASDGKGGLDTLNLRITVQKNSAVVFLGATHSANMLTINGSPIALPNLRGNQVKILLFALNGAKLTEQSVDLRNGNGSITLVGVKFGLYVLKIYAGDEVFAHRMILGNN